MKLKPILDNIILLIFCEIRNIFTFFPDKKFEIPKEEIPDYIIEKKITTADNEKLQAYLFQSLTNSRHSLITYFHGNSRNLYTQFDYAKKLYSMNKDVLIVSYRGYSKSTGRPSEEGIYIDGESTVNYAIKTLGYKEENITIFGRSLGSVVAIHVSRNRNFNGVILVSPLTSGKEMVKSRGFNFLKFIAGSSCNSLEKINDLNSKILIIHGIRDKKIPYEMGLKLFNTYHGAKHIATVEGAKHNDILDYNPDLVWSEIENFLK